MQLNIGIKIRELRHRDGRTQEALADALGVTSQAVSRWESGGSYPDMEMVPSIANYFHVSIDELFGYCSNREETIRHILEEAEKILSAQGFTVYKGSISDEVGACVDMLRKALEEFPNEPRLLTQLARALHMWGWNVYGVEVKANEETGRIEEDIAYSARNTYWREALEVYEKVLKANPSAEDREQAIRALTPLYCRMGEYEKAQKLAKSQGSMDISREFLLHQASTGEEKERYRGELIGILLVRLSIYIKSALTYNQIDGTEYEKQLLLAIIRLYETIFSDGRCGQWHQALGNTYCHLLKCEVKLGDSMEHIVECFDQIFRHYQAYEQIRKEGGYRYSAPLVAHLKEIQKDELKPMGDDFWKKELRVMPQNIVDELRKNQKYAECFAWESREA